MALASTLVTRQEQVCCCCLLLLLENNLQSSIQEIQRFIIIRNNLKSCQQNTASLRISIIFFFLYDRLETRVEKILKEYTVTYKMVL